MAVLWAQAWDEQEYAWQAAGILTHGVTLGAYADTERGVMVKPPLGMLWWG